MAPQPPPHRNLISGQRTEISSALICSNTAIFGPALLGHLTGLRLGGALVEGGLPLKIREGGGSPVRAVALVPES